MAVYTTMLWWPLSGVVLDLSDVTCAPLKPFEEILDYPSAAYSLMEALVGGQTTDWVNHDEMHYYHLIEVQRMKPNYIVALINNVLAMEFQVVVFL